MNPGQGLNYQAETHLSDINGIIDLTDREIGVRQSFL